MAKQKQLENQVETIVIDNFTGNLTWKVFGSMNSGLAQYEHSYGYNPYYQPGSLTWLSDPTDITGAMDGVPLAGDTQVESNVLYLYTITNAGKLYKVDTRDDSFSLLATLSAGTPTWAYGASMEFFNSKIWISNDKGLSNINFDGTGETQVGTWNSSNFIQNTYHPLSEFQGKLYIGNTTNGTSTNIGEIDSTNLIISQNRLSPALPNGVFVKDMDLAPDFSYLSISASTVPSSILLTPSNATSAGTGTSFSFKWNGTDQGVTAGTVLPNFNITSLNFFGDSSYLFMYDFFGAAIYDGLKKVLSCFESESPLPNASASSGNIIAWVSSSRKKTTSFSTQRGSDSLNFFGTFDNETPPIFFRPVFSTPANVSFNQVIAMPFLTFINSQMFVPAAGSVGTVGNKLYFSSIQFNGSSVATYKFYSFSIPAGFLFFPTNTPTTSGAYRTQIQKFAKKVNIKQIRFYVELPSSGAILNCNIINSDNSVMTNGSFAWTQGTDSDPIGGRINFNPSVETPYAFGVEFPSAGSGNILINKVEIDISSAGK